MRSLHFGGYAIVGPSLLEFGNDEQKAHGPGRDPRRHRVVRRHERAQRRLRPGRAVDPGGARRRLVRRERAEGVDVVRAPSPQKCFCYVRTDPTVPKHKGISVLIIDMDTPGVEIRPLKQVGGSSEFAEVFFTDALVPAENLVGDLNDGWRITMGSLAHERGGLWVEGVFGSLRAVDGLVRGGQATRASTAIRSCAASSATSTSASRRSAPSATRASRRSRRAARRRSTPS